MKLKLHYNKSGIYKKLKLFKQNNKYGITYFNR